MFLYKTHFFLFKSNTILQTNILNINNLFYTLNTLINIHIITIILQTKKPILNTKKTNHSKNNNNSTQHSNTKKTHTPTNTKQLNHHIFKLTPTISIILKPTPNQKQIKIYQ